MGLALMAWKDAKAALITYLLTVEFPNPFGSSPPTLRPQVVYDIPPASIPEDFVMVVYPPAVAVTRESVRRQKIYDVRVRVLHHDPGDIATATKIIDEAREVLIDEADKWLKLGQALDVSRMMGPGADEAAGYEYGGRSFIGVDMHYQIITSEARDHGA